MGWKERYVSAVEGQNIRLDELQATVLRMKLPHLDAENESRRGEHLPNTEKIAGPIPSLPMFPELREEQARALAREILEWCGA